MNLVRPVDRPSANPSRPACRRHLSLGLAGLLAAVCAPPDAGAQAPVAPAAATVPRPAAGPAAPAARAPGATPAAASTAGLDCLIQPSQTVQVGTASSGVVEAVRAERGDPVRKGQVLVQLESRVERAALAMAREKAEQLGEMKATKGASELARRELERASDLVKDNFVSKTYYDRQRAELEVAAGRGQQAEERRRLAEREVQLATAQLAQRTVVSPIDGVVVERLVSPGEYVEQKPVLRIAQVDPLRVDVLVPAVAFGQIAVGSRASVTPELLTRQARAAMVIGVDRVIDAASNTFRVRLELPNPGHQLPPGLRCKADLTATGSGATPTAPPEAKAAPATRQSRAGGSLDLAAR
jgi:RND family efflux transporter MFP subunit